MESYTLHVTSDEYGHDTYGPYETFKEAKAGRAAIRKNARGDKVKRTYLIERTQ